MNDDEDEVVINLAKMFSYGFLRARYDGEQVRKLEDEIILQNKKKVVLNCEGITGIGHGFADEIVGIYARAFGVDFIKENIRVINAAEAVRSVLNVAITVSIKYGQRVSNNSDEKQKF
jgi:sugar-specific transcriptional regulator TrmB